MGSIRAEFLKLKRSMSWAVVVLLPIIMVTAGSVSTLVGEGAFADGWHTLWIRSIGFYGMAILPVAIAILASLVWRVEHKNGNWNALMNCPVPTSHVIIGKATAVATLAAAMQAVLVITVIALGKLAFGLPGMLPTQYLFGSLLIMVAGMPVAAIQSAFSAFLRSFGAPIAIALVMTGASTMTLLIKMKIALALPYGLLVHTTQIGTMLVSGEGTSFEASTLSVASASFVLAASVAMTGALIALTAMAVNRTDTHN